MPSAASYHPIIIALFEIGPVLHDSYITWQEIQGWQSVTGTDLDPWEASLILDLSKEFFKQRESARSIACICPWPKGQNIWKYVQEARYKKQRDEEEARLKSRKEKEPHGTRKRH